MNRRIKSTILRISCLPPGDDPVAWLQSKMAAHGLSTLLAHADDGVIWGRLDGELLSLSHSALAGHTRWSTISPLLRKETLQQARAFNTTAELMLWRDGDGEFRARLLEDCPPDSVDVVTNAADFAKNLAEQMVVDGETVCETKPREYLDEYQLLWGTEPELVAHGFTLWIEGAQGMPHALPYPKTATPPRLGVRHYLAIEPSARIEISRLTGLFTAETDESDDDGNDDEDNDEDNGEDNDTDETPTATANDNQPAQHEAESKPEESRQ